MSNPLSRASMLRTWYDPCAKKGVKRAPDRPDIAGGERATHQRRELVVVADEDKDVGVPQRAQTHGQGHLRRLVHDAVVEPALDKERAADQR